MLLVYKSVLYVYVPRIIIKLNFIFSRSMTWMYFKNCNFVRERKTRCHEPGFDLFSYL